MRAGARRVAYREPREFSQAGRECFGRSECRLAKCEGFNEKKQG